ncbi:18293_t:CDS:2, partial [Gigaspora margarita]
DIDKCNFKEESTKSKERESNAKNTNCTNICKKGLKILSALIMVGQYYDTKKDILDAAQENAKNLGFAVAIKSSSSCHLYIHCKRSCQPRNNWDLTIDIKMLKAGTKPSMVYETVRNDDETPTATRKNILNLKERILMEALIT